MSQAPETAEFGQSLARPSRRLNWVLIAGWIAFFGLPVFCAVAFRAGPRLTAFGDISMSLAALAATCALLLNVKSSARREQAFWTLFAMGLAFWLVGQFTWTYFEVILRKDVPNPFIGDVVLFLHPVPMMGALALRPHDRRDDLKMHLGYVDFALLLLWWVYLYVFVVIPWQYLAPDVAKYGVAFDSLEGVENLLLAL